MNSADITAVPTTEHIQSRASSRKQASVITRRPVSTEENITSCDRAENPNRQATDTRSTSSSSQIQREEPSNISGGGLGSSSGGDINSGRDHWSSPSSTNLVPAPGPGPFNHGCPLPSQQGRVSSEKCPYVVCEVNDPPDSTVQESDVTGFVLSTETRSCDDAVDGDKVDKARETLESDCKAPAEIQFNPEEFNFDIGKL